MALPATFRTALALPLRRLMVMVLLPVVVVILGIFGYHFIEGWSYFDSLYMTVITLTTVGYAEIHELSNAGRVFTMFLCLGGVFILFYTATELVRAVVSGEVRVILGRQNILRMRVRLQTGLRGMATE